MVKLASLMRTIRNCYYSIMDTLCPDRYPSNAFFVGTASKRARYYMPLLQALRLFI